MTPLDVVIATALRLITKKDSLKESDGQTTHPVSHWTNCDLEPNIMVMGTL